VTVWQRVSHLPQRGGGEGGRGVTRWAGIQIHALVEERG
jgi:hypothetical protein